MYFVNPIDATKTDIAELSSDALPKLVTRVTHDGYLFSGTVRENLHFAKPDAVDAELIRSEERRVGKEC